MKPLMLHGHERSVTQIKYNRDGDLLFSAAKDAHPCVWYSVNGERLGTYEGHGGVVWAIDVDWETRHFMTGAGDNFLMLWDVKTGKTIAKVEAQTSVITCNFSYGGNLALYSTDNNMGKPSEIFVVDLRTVDNSTLKNSVHVMKFSLDKAPKATSMLWGALDQTLISGHENGNVAKWDMR
jgi:translation initiation factor 3 subunit I